MPVQDWLDQGMARYHQALADLYVFLGFDPKIARHHAEDAHDHRYAVLARRSPDQVLFPHLSGIKASEPRE
ncbi:MAG TPA: hypothetical protein VJB16_07370 [archaeon]|nr:hypothetical protein [archaeon]